MVPSERIPVSRRALIQRINRKLSHEDQVLKKYRAGYGGRWYSDLGDYYIVDVNRNFIVAGHIDIEKLGREEGVLKDWEYLAEEDNKD